MQQLSELGAGKMTGNGDAPVLAPGDPMEIATASLPCWPAGRPCAGPLAQTTSPKSAEW